MHKFITVPIGLRDVVFGFFWSTCFLGWYEYLGFFADLCLEIMIVIGWLKNRRRRVDFVPLICFMLFSGNILFWNKMWLRFLTLFLIFKALGFRVWYGYIDWFNWGTMFLLDYFFVRNLLQRVKVDDLYNSFLFCNWGSQKDNRLAG